MGHGVGSYLHVTILALRLVRLIWQSSSKNSLPNAITNSIDILLLLRWAAMDEVSLTKKKLNIT
jgi:hypothetical protein